MVANVLRLFAVREIFLIKLVFELHFNVDSFSIRLYKWVKAGEKKYY